MQTSGEGLRFQIPKSWKMTNPFSSSCNQSLKRNLPESTNRVVANHTLIKRHI